MHELERPEPGCGEVLVRVVASAVNPVDAKLRVDGGWAKLDPPVILGYDVAGIVEEVGPGITDFKNRRRGLLHSGNLWQPTWEFRRLQCRIRCDRRAQTYRSVICRSQCDSACRGHGLGGGVVRRLAVRPGETILIHGGAGGVGSFAVQFAKAAGARVLASASADNQNFLRQLGADVTIDYRKDDAAEITLRGTYGYGADAAFDIEGIDIVARCLPAGPTVRSGRLCLAAAR